MNYFINLHKRNVEGSQEKVVKFQTIEKMGRIGCIFLMFDSWAYKLGTNKFYNKMDIFLTRIVDNMCGGKINGKVSKDYWNSKKCYCLCRSISSLQRLISLVVGQVMYYV